jgi:glycosyltransferase involved in cell wall biosynthesis
MRALIFDPYVDTLGGGERYTFFVAKTLLDLGFSVEFAWNDGRDLLKAQDRFDFDLKKAQVNKKAYSLFFENKSNLLKRFMFTRKYDLIFYISDGGLPFLFGHQNLIHIQVPFKKISGNKFLNKLKLTLIDKIIYNSKFTRNVVEKDLSSGKDFVLYPPIDITGFRSNSKKENLIISVGRFDSPSHSKRQDILIKAFKKLSPKASQYELILAGGVKGNIGKKQVEDLKKQVDNLPVKFVLNGDFSKIKSLYAKAKIFWHAAGFEVDEELNPEKVEHFGMTTVEAMSAGCVPVVISKGGQKETVTKETGFLCNTIDEMVSSTLNLIKDEKQLIKMSHQSIKDSHNFSQEEFTKKIKNIIKF